MEISSKVRVACLLASVLLCGAIGCSKQHQDDQTIAQDIQSKVAADPVAQDSTVNVTSDQGKVTLKGTVKSRAAQQRVEQIASQEPGEAGVNDETAVVQAPGAEQAANTAPSANTAASTPEAPPPPAPAPVAPPPPPPPPPVVVPAGTSLIITVDQALSSKTSQTGQTFLATVAQPVTVDGKTAIPKGSSVSGTVVSAKTKGKIKGEGELSLALTSITIRHKNYPIQTDTFDSSAKGKGKRTAATTGGGAAGGALIGGIAGGGKGAGIGALLGAGAGLVGGAMTGNQQIEIPAETALTFRLSQSLTLPPRQQPQQ